MATLEQQGLDIFFTMFFLNIQDSLYKFLSFLMNTIFEKYFSKIFCLFDYLIQFSIFAFHYKKQVKCFQPFI